MLYGKDTLSSHLLFTAPPGIRRSPEEYVAEVKNQLRAIHETARTDLNIYNAPMKIRYDLAATEPKYKVGHRVSSHNPKKARRVCPNLDQTWDFIYEMMKVNDVVYRTRKIGGRTKRKVV